MGHFNNRERSAGREDHLILRLGSRRSALLRTALCLALQMLAVTTFVPHALAEEVAKPIPGLKDQDGHPYDGRSRTNGIRLVVFGYTNCPDICPTTLSDISLAISMMEPKFRDRVVPVFVTVDPRRDTADVLKDYLRPFATRFLGVTGPVEAIDAYAWANAVYAVRNDGSSTDAYSVDHSTSLLLISADGTVVDRIPYTTLPHDLARRIEVAIPATATMSEKRS